MNVYMHEKYINVLANQEHIKVGEYTHTEIMLCGVYNNTSYPLNLLYAFHIEKKLNSRKLCSFVRNFYYYYFISINYVLKKIFFGAHRAY